jgi:hypothetical protein
MLDPVGPLPPAVYWRRRVVAAGACVLALVLLVWIISGLVGNADEHPVHGTAVSRELAGSPSSRSSSSSTRPAAPSSTSSSSVAPPPPAPVRRCPDSVLEVVAQPDAPEYRVGEHPLLRLLVVNRGKAPCIRDVSRHLRELVITTRGGKRLWSSNDCFHPTETDKRTLAPDRPLRFSLNWAGRTSAPGCPAERVTVEPGRYRVVGNLGTITGPAARLTLTP